MTLSRPAADPAIEMQLAILFGELNTTSFVDLTWKQLVPQTRFSINDSSFDMLQKQAETTGFVTDPKWEDVVHRMQLHYMQKHHIDFHRIKPGTLIDLTALLCSVRDTSQMILGVLPRDETCAEYDVKMGAQVYPLLEKIAIEETVLGNAGKGGYYAEMIDELRDMNCDITFQSFSNEARQKTDKPAPDVPWQDIENMGGIAEEESERAEAKEDLRFHEYWYGFHDAMFVMTAATVDLFLKRVRQLRDQPN